MVFRPKTHRDYQSMFSTFVAFCLFTKSPLSDLNVKVILSFLECLVRNACSASMVTNDVSAIKASCIALKINRPVTITSHNVITISHLVNISLACDLLTFPQVFRATFLLGFFDLF